MRIIIDILHPAHVHFFKNFVWIMQKHGHNVLVTARDKDVVLRLLDAYKIKYVKISKVAKTKIGLLGELIKRNLKFFKVAKKFKPDILIGCMGPTIASVGFLMRIPRIVFYNNENATLTNPFSQPLATAFITSTSYSAKVRGNHITHKSYHELAYLHPKYFKPDKSVLKKVGIKKNQKFFIVRFVSWQATHDISKKGIDIKNKRRLVNLLEKYGKVVITSETPLPKEFEKYRMSVPPEKMHDLLYYASMYIGEGATIASEAAVLGVPPVYINPIKLGFLNELRKDYGLVYDFTKPEKAIKKIEELLKNKNLKKQWKKKRDKMLKDKIDLTEYMVDYIENKTYKKKVNRTK